MIIVVTRTGKRIGISTVVGAIDTRILTGEVNAALREDLKELSCDKPQLDDGLIQYEIEVQDESGERRNFFAVQDPQNPWSTTLKRILNKTGLMDRV